MQTVYWNIAINYKLQAMFTFKTNDVESKMCGFRSTQEWALVLNTRILYQFPLQSTNQWCRQVLLSTIHPSGSNTSPFVLFCQKKPTKNQKNNFVSYNNPGIITEVTEFTNEVNSSLENFFRTTHWIVCNPKANQNKCGPAFSCLIIPLLPFWTF